MAFYINPVNSVCKMIQKSAKIILQAKIYSFSSWNAHFKAKIGWKSLKNCVVSPLDTLVSGSPIIQDGKLIGAVTHVLVDDPTKGYGIFAENMFDTSQTLTENQLKTAS